MCYVKINKLCVVQCHMDNILLWLPGSNAVEASCNVVLLHLGMSVRLQQVNKVVHGTEGLYCSATFIGYSILSFIVHPELHYNFLIGGLIQPRIIT